MGDTVGKRLSKSDKLRGIRVHSRGEHNGVVAIVILETDGSGVEDAKTIDPRRDLSSQLIASGYHCP